MIKPKRYLLQNNINTIENKRHINMIYNNRAKPNFKIKKNDGLYSRLLNKRKINDTSGNKNGNSNNFRMLIYNKSVDNKYSKEKYKGINNYMNYNFWKINNIREIRKKIRNEKEEINGPKNDRQRNLQKRFIQFRFNLQ